MASLCFFGFWLGFEIGGDYANKKIRGAFIAAVFATQGFGILTDGMFAVAMSAASDAIYKSLPYAADPISSTAPQSDYPLANHPHGRRTPRPSSRSTGASASRCRKLPATPRAADMSKVHRKEIEGEEERKIRAKSELFRAF